MTQENGGFALFIVVIMVALLLTTAAAVVTTDLAVQDRARIDAGQKSLTVLDTAVNRFYADSVRMYPSRLTHLTAPVAASDTASCGSLYGSTNAARWKGPYLSQVVPSTGLQIGVGTAQVRMVRTGATTARSATDLYIVVTSVRETDALKLDEKMDAADGRTAGKLRWDQASTEGITTMQYYVKQGITEC